MKLKLSNPLLTLVAGLTSKKNRILSYALLGVLSISSFTVFAQTVDTPAQNAVTTGTISLPDNSSNSSETAQYLSLAKVTLQDAVTAAQKATGLSSAPSLANLSNDNGFLVWAVVLGDQMVKIDAGDGSVLYQAAVASVNTTIGQASNNKAVNDASGTDNDGDNDNGTNSDDN